MSPPYHPSDLRRPLAGLAAVLDRNRPQDAAPLPADPADLLDWIAAELRRCGS
jgi:hypothetical protein